MDLAHKLETSPLVVDGVMYLSEPPSNVTALDVRTGQPFWRYRRPIPQGVRYCCGQVNRGVAVLGGRVFIGTIDAHLVSLDAQTGRVRWDVEVEAFNAGYSITAAPLVVKDKVIIGVSGGEFGVVGFLDAYDAATGRRVWRRYTIPANGMAEQKTWTGESWGHGSATTWMTGSYDPALNLIYWGTGNPGPNWNGDERAGDNLFTDCLLAIDADTSALKWHFQFTPHDVWSYDAAQVPVLVDAPFKGKPRRLIVTPNRNGFYYVLDRATGEFLLAEPFVKQTWAARIDEKGKPVAAPNAIPSADGAKVYPSPDGATNWHSPTYSPITKLLYAAVSEAGAVYYKAPFTYRPGSLYSGGSWHAIPGEEPRAAVRALQLEDGKMKWEFPLQTPGYAGLLSTAGGLVFGGTDEGHFFALDASTGKPLWRFPTGGRIAASPVTYMVDGRQQVAIASGQAIVAFALE
jgi:alcohol dehydrogenase (cytochrome c)